MSRSAPPQEDEAAIFAALSPKQRDVLDRLLQHRTTKEIAEELGISPYTVDQRINTIKVKLGTNDRGSTARTYAMLRDKYAVQPHTAQQFPFISSVHALQGSDGYLIEPHAAPERTASHFSDMGICAGMPALSMSEVDDLNREVSIGFIGKTDFEKSPLTSSPISFLDGNIKNINLVWRVIAIIGIAASFSALVLMMLSIGRLLKEIF